MPGYREPTPEELEESRDARISRQELDRLEICVNYLEQAARLRADSNRPHEAALSALIESVRTECLELHKRCAGRVASRRRPRKSLSADTCTIFLDECGQHALGASDPFPVFVLAATIIRDVDFAVVDAKWKRWKHDELGSDAVVHEPDVRNGYPPFRGVAGQAAAEKLPEILSELDFVALAIVVHRADYVADFGTGPLDASLPAHAYMMALDFLMERAVLALDDHFGGAKALLVAESRGPKENALLQHEFSRLHLEGTSYISAAWFRQQLRPGIQFQSKTDNSTGLQLSDLLARPVGEKVAAPDQDPVRWAVFRDKLCAGQETKNSILGLKIVPWRERYRDLWKS
ncbi:MAG: DUF3800 domain-containing protein [Acidimicrobiales bacterium]|jgi:hypothetical protein